MDNQEQSPLFPLTTDVNNIPYLFSSSFPPPLMLNNNIFPPVPANLQNPQINLDNIDWASLLCGNIMDNNNNNNTGDQQQQQQQQQMPQVLSEGDQNSGRNININNIGNYKGKNSRSKKSIPPRVAFHTRSSEDVLDDGYRWRKYGQKAVKNSIHPRSYYRCTHHTCNVKKQIQRLSKDTSIVVTTYEGIHNHPCEKLMETLTPLLKQIQFLSRF